MGINTNYEFAQAYFIEFTNKIKSVVNQRILVVTAVALIALSSLVLLGVYLYRQQKKWSPMIDKFLRGVDNSPVRGARFIQNAQNARTVAKKRASTS